MPRNNLCSDINKCSDEQISEIETKQTLHFTRLDPAKCTVGWTKTKNFALPTVSIPSNACTDSLTVQAKRKLQSRQKDSAAKATEKDELNELQRKKLH